jgi:predicted ATPase
MGLFRASRGDPTEARNLVDELMKIAQRMGDNDLLIEAHMAYGTAQMGRGNLSTALHHLDESIARYGPERHRSHVVRFSLDPGVNSLSRSSWTLWFLGFPDQALERSNRMLALAHDLGHTHSLALGLCFAAMFHQFRREPLQVQDFAQAAVTLCTEHQLSQFGTMGRFMLGWTIAQQGRSDAGIREMRESLAEYQRIGATLYLEVYLGLLAEALTAERNADEGLAIVEQALRAIRFDVHVPELHRLKGDLLLVRRRRSEAEQSFLLTLDTARRQGSKSFELRAAVSLARLWTEAGRRDEARDLLAPVYGWFTEGFDTPDLVEAKGLLDALS